MWLNRHIKSVSLYLPRNDWNVGPRKFHPQKAWTWGGAPPHTDNRIRQAARGQGQVGLYKTTRQSQNAPLFWLSDSLEHGLNISETPRSCALQRAPVRWTLTLKTNHLWSLGPCQCRNTTEQRLQRRAFPVTSRSRGSPKEHEPTTWHPKQRTELTRENETKKQQTA